MDSRKTRLLNTAEAARLLRVSEASIRRWSDSGLLRAARIGRRRERRFHESDLLAFGELPPSKRAPIGTVNVGGMAIPVPIHLAPLYSTDEGRLRLTVPFLAEGIRLGQPVFLVANGPVLATYLDALGAQAGVDLERAQKDGLFTLVAFEGDGSAAIAQFERLFGEALATRQTLIRLVGEMACVLTMFSSEDEMLRFEEAFEVMFRRYQIAAICQYDVRLFDGPSLLRMLKAHPDLFGLRSGTFFN
ncbi:MAG TPA: MEDS domain-containing protein [Candidatus Dormibacteraeota bacterium]|nr:MEDS domain-containing protein [Candidatus Dormibacteraeota bacterium]